MQPSSTFLSMQSSARRYSCCRCQAQVIICSQCDRGNRYCAGQCAAGARSASLKRAADKYRSTRAGRFNNATRQQRYRQRQQQIVTHQGSPLVVSHAVLTATSYWPEKVEPHDQNGRYLISALPFCGAVAGRYHCDTTGCSSFRGGSRLVTSGPAKD